MPPFDPFRDLGRLLVILGVVLVIVGGLLVWGPKLPGRLGRLPGDILIRRQNYTFYFPLATSIIVSLLLSLIFWFLSRK